MRKLEVIFPRTQADLDRCAELDAQGLLISGSSYPTAVELAGDDGLQKTIERIDRREADNPGDRLV